MAQPQDTCWRPPWALCAVLVVGVPSTIAHHVHPRRHAGAALCPATLCDQGCNLRLQPYVHPRRDTTFAQPVKLAGARRFFGGGGGHLELVSRLPQVEKGTRG